MYDSQPVLRPDHIAAAVPYTRLDANVNAPIPLSTQQALDITQKLINQFKEMLEFRLQQGFNSADVSCTSLIDLALAMHVDLQRICNTNATRPSIAYTHCKRALARSASVPILSLPIKNAVTFWICRSDGDGVRDLVARIAERCVAKYETGERAYAGSFDRLSDSIGVMIAAGDLTGNPKELYLGPGINNHLPVRDNPVFRMAIDEM
ncbi:hypothetical protein NX059_012188 [Plenodomus lindquistii]|nr:hypothetical protein NX059_012188 [Plenodomus lindquistii]